MALILENIIHPEGSGFSGSGQEKIVVRHFDRRFVCPACLAVVLEISDSSFSLASIDNTGNPAVTAFFVSCSSTTTSASGLSWCAPQANPKEHPKYRDIFPYGLAPSARLAASAFFQDHRSGMIELFHALRKRLSRYPPDTRLTTPILPRPSDFASADRHLRRRYSESAGTTASIRISSVFSSTLVIPPYYSLISNLDNK
jgi:hypothetical protein